MYYNSNLVPDNYDFIDPSLIPTEFPFCIPPIDCSPELPIDMFTYLDFEVPESNQMLQMFDQTLQTYTKEFLKMYPNIIDPSLCADSPTEKPRFLNKSTARIGTISAEERRQKVLKYLEKRKRRVYTKKISYFCRKRVADQRERCKGRFISKKAADETKKES